MAQHNKNLNYQVHNDHLALGVLAATSLTLSGDLTVDGGGSLAAGAFILRNGPQNLNVSNITTAQAYSLGTQYKSGLNTFRYCSFAASTAVVPGTLMQSVVQAASGGGLANSQTAIALAVAMAVGDTTVSVTLDATSVSTTLNSMAGSTLSVEDGGAAQGSNYLIIGNTAAVQGTTCVLTLDPNTPVVAAMAVGGTTSLNILASPFANAIQSVGTTITAPLIGIYQGNDDGTNATPFGWVQTGGNATGLSGAQNAFVVGEMVGATAGATPAGAIDAEAAGNSLTTFNRVGLFAGIAGAITAAEGIPIKICYLPL